MKYIILTISFLTSIWSYSQELVPNGSFEDTIICPTGAGQINNSLFWINPTASSPDYFHPCSIIMSPEVSPESGLCYAGLFAYDSLNLNSREYIQIKLTDTLEFQKTYCISFYVQLHSLCRFAITPFGMYFSESPINSNDFLYLPFTPQVFNSSLDLLSNKVDWMNISANYVAQGNEQYITIGNFFDDNNSNVFIIDTNLQSTGQYKNAYYYIDDISIKICDEKILKIPNAFSPNNDEWNNQFVVENLPEGASVQIYNRWGVLITEWDTPNGNWDGRLKGGSEASAGVYYCIVKLPDGEMKSSFVHLIR